MFEILGEFFTEFFAGVRTVSLYDLAADAEILVPVDIFECVSDTDFLEIELDLVGTEGETVSEFDQ